MLSFCFLWGALCERGAASSAQRKRDRLWTGVTPVFEAGSGSWLPSDLVSDVFPNFCLDDLLLDHSIKLLYCTMLKCVGGGGVCVWDEVGWSEGPKWENLSNAAVAADVLEWLLLWSSDRKGKFSHSFISFSIAWGIGPQLVWISYFATRLGRVQTCWVWPLVFFLFLLNDTSASCLFCPSLPFAL